MSKSKPPMPWMHHDNHSASSLSEYGMEIGLPPSLPAYPPSPTLSDFSNKALPPVPGPRRTNTSAATKGKRPDLLALDPRQTYSASDLSKTKLPPPPPTPMSKSSRKVLQLTGFNPNYEKTFQDELHRNDGYDVESLFNSGSEYSHDGSLPPEAEHPFQANDFDIPKSLSHQQPAVNPDFFLQSKVYSSPAPSERHLDWGVKSQASSIKSSLHPPNTFEGVPEPRHIRRNEAVTYEDLIEEERSRFENMSDDVWGQNMTHYSDDSGHFEHTMQEPDLIPRPLAIRPRPQTAIEEARPVSRFSDHSSETNSHSIFSSARESFALGMRELSSPLKTKYARSPSSPLGKMLPPPKPKKKKESHSGGHSLKSPFPFDSARRASVASLSGAGTELRRKVSGVVRRISGSGNPGTRETVVSSQARRASGPDTPLPHKTGLMARLQDSEILQRGNDHLQDAVAKAKKTVRIKSEAERRRDHLKKNITVIGHTDQTPDGRVSEWV